MTNPMCLKCYNYQVMPHFWVEGEVIHPDSLEFKCILDSNGSALRECIR